MSALSDLGVRLRALLFRRAEERELDEELRTHVEMEAEYRKRSGQSAAAAHRESVIALGGIERVKDDVRDARGTRLLEDSAGDVSFSLRTLSRNPGFASVAVLTLAIGIGGTTAVFSAVDAVLLQPLPYQQPGQLVRLFQNDVKHLDDRGFVTPVHYLAFRQRMSSFEATAAVRTYDETGADIGTGDHARRVRLLPTSADYFDVVRVHPQLGRGFNSDEENGAAVVVVSHHLWEEQLHGDVTAVGRTMTMNGKPYTVVGVMPDGFSDPLAGAVDAWVPVDVGPGRDPSNSDNHYFTVIARLRPATPIARAQAELDGVAIALAKQYPDAKDARARLYPLKEDIVGSSSRALEIMLGAVALVLVLVCVNIANLLLVRGSERAQEFALRSALGAERTRLVRQMLIESLTLALAGDIAGLVVARLAMSAIVALGAGTIPRLATLTLDVRLLAFSLVVATGSAVLFGLAPALRVARTQPGDVLRGQSRSTTGGAKQLRLREWLVVSQVALAFVLLVGAGLLLSSFEHIRQVELGVKTNGVLTFELHLPSARYDSTARGQFYDRFAAAVEAIPGVRAAGGVSKLPATGRYHTWGVQAMTGPLANTKRGGGAADQRVISGDYLQAVGIPVLKGRAFGTQDNVAAPNRVLVSKSLADDLFPNADAIGQQIRTGGRVREIIGVVGDVAVDNEGRPQWYVYHAHRQFAGDRNWALTQVIALRDPHQTLQPAIRRLLSSLDPELVMYKPMMLDDVIGNGAAQRVFTLRILMAFAAVALGLAALGLFGVLSYGVRLRAREFSIRMALGAEQGSIRGMILRQGLTVTAIGLAIGIAGALLLSRFMASVLFKVSPLDPFVLGGAVVLMSVVGGLAAYVPAHRATASDPRAALQ
jgi:putative ABC transport system permease protein